MSTILTHVICGHSANLECMSEMYCMLKRRDAKITPKSPSAHHRTTLSGYIFATKACIDNWKNLLNGNISSICHHNMVNFGSQSLRRGTKNLIMELSQRAPPIFGRAAITLAIGRHSSIISLKLANLC